MPCAALTTDAPERASCTVSLTLLVGGARSGKSTLAVEIGRRFEKNHNDATVTFIATAPRSDDDMDRRID
ncbi:bifunctional adenosylcobinamide kinase/adenosylcobinamide-phosphate guanylyltransferase, partial [Ilumatobacter sp.]|uniref:bifunctional adenosylcobinamide kinase/adenosylcobinamide-phosphate guanylyltransferase n=1 Tax=Ilumatobacter sp. TaxID=1967498 RepID=UPI00374FEA91